MLLEKPEKASEVVNDSDFKKKAMRLLMLGRSEMSTYESKQIKYRTIFDTVKTIIRQDGIRGCFKGLQLRMLMQSVSSGLSWGTYQLVKNLVSQRNTH